MLEKANKKIFALAERNPTEQPRVKPALNINLSQIFRESFGRFILYDFGRGLITGFLNIFYAYIPLTFWIDFEIF